MVVYLLSSALKSMLISKTRSWRKNSKTFESDLKNAKILQKRQLAIEKDSKNSSPKIGLLIVNYDRSYRLSWKKIKKNFLGIVLPLSNRQKTAGT